MSDKRVITCNYSEGTKIASEGAKAFVLLMNRGNGSERVYVAVRSRGGRYVEKWEAVRRLENFRFVNVPPEKPIYNAHWMDFAEGRTPEDLSELNKASFREVAARMIRVAARPVEEEK